MWKDAWIVSSQRYKPKSSASRALNHNVLMHMEITYPEQCSDFHFTNNCLELSRWLSWNTDLNVGIPLSKETRYATLAEAKDEYHSHAAAKILESHEKRCMNLLISAAVQFSLGNAVLAQECQAKKKKRHELIRSKWKKSYEWSRNNKCFKERFRQKRLVARGSGP